MTARASLRPALVGAFTVAAGLVHAGAAGAHRGHGELALLFAVTAGAQLALGAAVLLRPGRAAIGAATAVNLAALAAWALSRTVGLPAVESLAHPHPVGLQDAMAVLAELAAATAATAGVAGVAGAAAGPRCGGRPRASGRGAWPVVVLALVPALVGMTAPHSHPVEHHHGEAAADPLFAGLDTTGATEGDLAAARALILATREAVVRSFPDEEAVVRAGYRSIGDGRRPGTYEHYVHAGYLSDGRELDPDRIESIVLENTGAGKRVASAMYILEMGKTMADVPDVAGPLTVWHDHQNLCWDDAGIRLAGVLLNGRCVPRGTFHPTPPMLHVWVQDHPCGPFAGIDGHGGGRCGGAHSH